MFFLVDYKIVIKAADIYEYDVYFDYELVQTRNLSSSVIDSSNNICKARIEKANGAMSDFQVMIYGNKNYNTDTIKQNSYISFFDFDIVVNTSYSNIKIELDDENYNPIFESDSECLYVYDLIEQKYYVTITCEDYYSEIGSKVYINNKLTVTFSFYFDNNSPVGKIYNENGETITSNKTNSNYITFKGTDSYSGIKEMYYIDINNNKITYSQKEKIYSEGTYKFYCVDYAGNISNSCIITIDKTKPILVIENAIAYSDASESFTVSVLDNNVANLYYKNPLMSIFTSTVNNTVTIKNTSPKGIYYFYAIDNFNNKSNEVWINYGGDDPIVKIKTMNNSNSIYLTWEVDGLNVLINDITYNKDDIIYDEGDYEIKVIDKDNNISKLYYTIECYYIKEKIIDSTCMSEGYTIYHCISCENIKYDDYTLQGSHSYNHYQKEPTCIECGGLYYYCIYCNYNYTINQIPPTNHHFKHTLIDSTCYTTGVRIIECLDCDYYIEEEISIKQHKYVLLGSYTKNNETINQYMCEYCMEIHEQEEDNKSVLIINFVSFLQEKYFPYIVWILLTTVGMLSIIIGSRIIFLKQSDEQFITKNIIKNYIFGLVSIFILVVCIPLIIKAISLI